MYKCVCEFSLWVNRLKLPFSPGQSLFFSLLSGHTLRGRIHFEQQKETKDKSEYTVLLFLSLRCCKRWDTNEWFLNILHYVIGIISQMQNTFRSYVSVLLLFFFVNSIGWWLPINLFAREHMLEVVFPFLLFNFAFCSQMSLKQRESPLPVLCYEVAGLIFQTDCLAGMLYGY